MKIFAAYGSTKDISVYTSLGLPPSQIYIVGRPTKKMQHQCQVSKRKHILSTDVAFNFFSDQSVSLFTFSCGFKELY